MSQSLRRHLHQLSRGDGLGARLVRGVMGVGVLQFVSLALSLATSIVLARGLGPEGFGQYSFVMTVLTILALPFGEGVSQLITREVAQYAEEGVWPLFRGLLRRMHQWLLTGSFAVAFIIAGVGLSRAAWQINDRWTLLVLGSGMLPLFTLLFLRISVLRGLNKVVLAQIPPLLARPGIHLLAITSLLFWGWLNPLTALSGQLAAVGVAFIIGAWALNRYWPAAATTVAPRYEQRKWLGAWLPFALLAGTNFLNAELGILLLGWLGTEEQIAALRVASRGALLVAMSIGIVNMVVGPYIARAYQAANWGQLQKLYTQSARSAAAIGVPIAVVFIFWGRPIIDLVYGSDYAVIASLPLAILCVGQVVHISFASPGLYLVMIGHERDELATQIIAIALNVILAVGLIPAYGAVGAAIAAAMFNITRTLVAAAFLWFRVRLRPLFI